MKIKKVKDKILIEIPYWSKRCNPYMPGEDVGSHPTLMGLITKDRWGNDEIGFAKVIDMDYKDKGDQWTDIMIHVWDMEKKDFKALCEKLRIGWVDDGLADPNVDYEND